MTRITARIATAALILAGFVCAPAAHADSAAPASAAGSQSAPVNADCERCVLGWD